MPKYIVTIERNIEKKVVEGEYYNDNNADTAHIWEFEYDVLSSQIALEKAQKAFPFTIFWSGVKSRSLHKLHLERDIKLAVEQLDRLRNHYRNTYQEL